MPDLEKKRRIMRTFKLDEISAVDRAAQVPAGIAIIKSDTTTKTSDKSDDTADAVGNQPQEDPNMADKNADTVSAKDLEKSQAEVSKLQAIVDLDPVHRDHYDNLPVSKQDDFLTMPDADKDAAVETVAKSNPVVHTAADGTEYRKSDDPRLIQMAKERDEDRESMQKFRKEAEDATFAKQADEVLGSVPGEKVAKVAAVRAISSIEDEDVRKSVFEILEGANKVYAGAMATLGKNDTVAAANTGAVGAGELLQKAIDACKKEDGVGTAEATKKVLATQAGQRLYAESRKERIASQAVN